MFAGVNEQAAVFEGLFRLGVITITVLLAFSVVLGSSERNPDWRPRGRSRNSPSSSYAT